MSPDTSGFSHLPRITTSLALTCGSDVSEVGDVGDFRPFGAPYKRVPGRRRRSNSLSSLRPRPGGTQEPRAP